MSDESVDNKTQEQRASGSEQVLGMERVSALIMRPSFTKIPTGAVGAINGSLTQVQAEEDPESCP